MGMAKHAEALRMYLTERMQHYNVPGVSIGIARPGEPELFIGAVSRTDNSVQEVLPYHFPYHFIAIC
jgi:hypothetical protein